MSDNPSGPPPTYLPPDFYAGPSDPLVSANFGGWWARSFRLFQTAWRPMTLIMLVSVVPMFIVSVALSIMTKDAIDASSATNDPATIDLDTVFEPLLSVAPFYLVAALLSPLTQLACLRLLVEVATGRPASIGAALLAGLRRTAPLIGWSLLGGLLVIVGLVFCLVPGFYVFAVITILAPIVLLERGNAVGRAFQLFHSDFGAAIARIATMIGLIIGIGVFGIILASAIAPTGTENVVLLVVAELITAVGTLAAAVLTTPMLLTAYADMRARREPFSTAYLADVR